MLNVAVIKFQNAVDRATHEYQEAVKRATQEFLASDIAIMSIRQPKLGAFLTKRQQQVFEGLLAGKIAKEIGDELGITHRGVKFHISAIYKKTKVNSRLELFRLYQQEQGLK